MYNLNDQIGVVVDYTKDTGLWHIHLEALKQNVELP